MKSARCHVFTKKEGLLSKMAHDLRIRVDRFDVKIEGAGDTASVTASFDATSLVVESAIEGGVDKTRALSAGDREKIEKTIKQDVLQARRHPEIRFRSTRVSDARDGLSVEGDLDLNGQNRKLTLTVRDLGDAWETSTTLHQPDFGIKPYRAALGALRIKPDVRVELWVPKP